MMNSPTFAIRAFVSAAICAVLWHPTQVTAQEYVKEIPLYSGVVPGSEKWDWSENTVTNDSGLPMVTDVVRPVLLHYPADAKKAVGTAMIVAPGGAFRVLMMSYEGVDIAKRLNAMGVDAFVLKYRQVHNGPGAPAAPDARVHVL